MVATEGAFDFDINIHGAAVTIRREPLMPRCLDSGSIDANIRILKDNLDVVAELMKHAVAVQNQKPDF